MLYRLLLARSRPGLALLGLAAAAALLSACGLGRPAPASAHSGSGNNARAQKAMAAAKAQDACLKKAGYRLVGPPPDEVPENAKIVNANGADDQMRNDPGYKAAYDKCAAQTGFKQFADLGNAKPPSAKEIEKNNKRTLKVYACMRQKGWTLTDPTKDSHGSLNPPQPPSDVQGNQARMNQFTNDLRSCLKANGGGDVVTQTGGGNGGGGGGISVGGS
jgi:hypothetical protein